MPLSLLRAGENCRVAKVSGPADVSKRLTNLGFSAGEPVAVVGKCGAAVIVCVRDCRIALDSGAACCIHVSALN